MAMRAELACTMLVLATIAFPSRVLSQDLQRDLTIDNLPRPGYQPRTIIAGNVVISPAVDISAAFNNNIYAVPNDLKSDVILSVRPSVAAKRDSPSLDLAGSVYIDARRYAKNTGEDVTGFGAAASGRKYLGNRQSITAKVSFDRTFERRTDPEADFRRSLAPALINVTAGDLEYRYTGPRVGFLASVGATKLNYLPVVDSDRDLTTYRAVMRGSVNIAPRLAMFLQAYANRREAGRPTDRGGIDRTTTTFGFLAGVSIDIADRLTGEMGVGVFRAKPGDIGLDPFTGIAASGRIIWHPRTRTALALDVFRGDVATVRIGAIGRVDTRIGLSVDQEVRHNLLLRGAVGVRKIDYRGTFDQSQRYTGADLEARYLMNRHWTWSVGGNYMQRHVNQNLNSFKRWQANLGVRYTY
jgi:hypothetical protein